MVIDIQDPRAKFNMNEVVSFLKSAKLDYLIKTFMDAKYIP